MQRCTLHGAALNLQLRKKRDYVKEKYAKQTRIDRYIIVPWCQRICIFTEHMAKFLFLRDDPN